MTDSIIDAERLYKDGVRTANLEVTVYDGRSSCTILIEFDNYDTSKQWLYALKKVANDNAAYSPEEL